MSRFLFTAAFLIKASNFCDSCGIELSDSEYGHPSCPSCGMAPNEGMEVDVSYEEDEAEQSNVRHINPGTVPIKEEVGPEVVEAEDEELDDSDLGHFQTSSGYAPKRIVTAYKLFRVDQKRPGQLFPLFVDSHTPIPMGVWVDAAAGEQTPEGKVKSKLGPLAYRPGFHAGDSPVATHIGLRGKSNSPVYRNPDYVWAEVSMTDDYDWQTEAAARMRYTKKNKPVPASAHITDQVPFGGYYRYKTNPKMTGDWMISGNMRINRVLTDEEVKQINGSSGVNDLPRQEPLNLSRYGFGPNGKPLVKSALLKKQDY